MSPVSKVQQGHVNKYIKNKYDRVNLILPKGLKAELQKVSASKGESVNKFIVSAIDDKLDDIFCQQLLDDYLASDDKGDFIPLEEAAASLGIQL